MPIFTPLVSLSITFPSSTIVLAGDATVALTALCVGTAGAFLSRRRKSARPSGHFDVEAQAEAAIKDSYRVWLLPASTSGHTKDPAGQPLSRISQEQAAHQHSLSDAGLVEVKLPYDIEANAGLQEPSSPLVTSPLPASLTIPRVVIVPSPVEDASVAISQPSRSVGFYWPGLPSCPTTEHLEVPPSTWNGPARTQPKRKIVSTLSRDSAPFQSRAASPSKASTSTWSPVHQTPSKYARAGVAHINDTSTTCSVFSSIYISLTGRDLSSLEEGWGPLSQPALVGASDRIQRVLCYAGRVRLFGKTRVH